MIGFLIVVDRFGIIKTIKWSEPKSLIPESSFSLDELMINDDAKMLAEVFSRGLSEKEIYLHEREFHFNNLDKEFLFYTQGVNNLLLVFGVEKVAFDSETKLELIKYIFKFVQTVEMDRIGSYFNTSEDVRSQFEKIQILNNELINTKRALEKSNPRLLQSQAQLEQIVLERTSELQLANKALKEAVRHKDQFLAAITHELRTPLTGIIGLSDVLNMQPSDQINDKHKKALKHISLNGHRLLLLVNDILDFARIEAQQLILHFELCQVNVICEGCLKSFSIQAQEKNLQTHWIMDPISIIIRADRKRLRQMLSNLLSNALKFTPKDGNFGIEVRGDKSNNFVHITVWDTGIGISSEDLPRLFKTFVQLDGSLERKFNGIGLGLVLVQRLTDLHGGSVIVESNLGVGSRFTISLPWEGLQ